MLKIQSSFQLNTNPSVRKEWSRSPLAFLFRISKFTSVSIFFVPDRFPERCVFRKLSSGFGIRAMGTTFETKYIHRKPEI